MNDENELCNLPELDPPELSLSSLRTSGSKVISEKTSEKIEEMISSPLTDGELISREIAKAAEMDFYRVCAYNGYGIMSLFNSVAERLLQLDDSPPVIQKEEVTVLPLNQKKNKSCFCIPHRKNCFFIVCLL